MSTDRSVIRIQTVVPVVVAVGAVAIGVLAGRSIAYQSSVGEMSFIGAGILAFFVAAAVVVLAVIGLIGLAIRHGHLSRVAVTFLAAAGLLALGTVGGQTTAAATGGTYHEPAVLHAMGVTHADMHAAGMPFVAKDGGRADCQSVPDGRTVGSVWGLDVGKLGSGTLRTNFGVPATAADGAQIELFVDGADITDGMDQPSWTGPVQVTALDADGTTGTLTFTGLTLSDPAAKPDPAGSTGPSLVTGWPATISGTLSWSCQPW